MFRSTAVNSGQCPDQAPPVGVSSGQLQVSNVRHSSRSSMDAGRETPRQQQHGRRQVGMGSPHSNLRNQIRGNRQSENLAGPVTKTAQRAPHQAASSNSSHGFGCFRFRGRHGHDQPSFRRMPGTFRQGNVSETHKSQGTGNASKGVARPGFANAGIGVFKPVSQSHGQHSVHVVSTARADGFWSSRFSQRLYGPG